MLIASMTSTLSSAFENIKFEPVKFVENLVYLAIGLIGIFIVIGIIILVTFILNRIPEGKKDKDNQ